MGLTTGYIFGRKARQEETGRELTNIRSQYEFQEYLDTREYRDLTKKAEAVGDKITIETAPSKLERERTENIAEAVAAVC